MGFLEELKQRRVVRVLLGYLVAAWVAIEVTSTVAPLMTLPDWVPQLVLALTGAALPGVLLLAWFFDWDPAEGLQRAPAAPSKPTGRRRAGLWAAGAVATVVLAGAGFALGVRWSGEDGGGDAPDRVVVGVFDNRTGDASLAPLGQMASDWITQGLLEARFIEVADPQTALAIQQGHAANAGVVPVDVLGSEAGASLVVRGSFYRTGDELRFNAEVVDVEAGQVVAALPPVAAQADDPLTGVEQLRQRVVTALALQIDRSLETFEVAPARPPPYAAYEAYMEGLRLYLEGRYPASREAFDRATAIDSTFDSALIWAAHGYWFGDSDTMDDRLALAESRRGRMSSYDRARLDWMLGFRYGDFERIYQANRSMVAAAPGSINARRELALSAMRTRRYDEAREIFDELYPFVGLTQTWSERYVYYTELLHLQGDYVREAEVVTEGEAAGQVASEFARMARARAAAGQGDAARARAIADSIVDPTGGTDLLIGIEMIGHGSPSGGALLERALERAQSASQQPAGGLTDGVEGGSYPAWIAMFAAYRTGRYDLAESRLRRLLAQEEGDEFWPRLLGPSYLALIVQRRSLESPSDSAARLVRTLLERASGVLSETDDADWWSVSMVESTASAQVAALRGDSARALEILQRVPDIRDGRYLYIHQSADPDLASLHGWPPFERLVRGVD